MQMVLSVEPSIYKETIQVPNRMCAHDIDMIDIRAHDMKCMLAACNLRPSVIEWETLGGHAAMRK